MAYERTWYPMPKQGPFNWSGHADNQAAGVIVRLYRFLTNYQNIRGVGAPAWVVTQSCDGTTVSASDLWAASGGSPYAFQGSENTPHAWVTLRTPNPVNGAHVWIHLKYTEAAGWGAGIVPLVVGASEITQSLTTGFPTCTRPLLTGTASDTHWNLSQNYAVGSSTVVGNMSASGDFWFAVRAGGVTAMSFIVANPVGCASNDTFPWFASLICFGTEPYAPRFTPNAGGFADNLTVWHTGATGGYQCLNLPCLDFALLDVNGSKLFDLDAKVFVVNVNTPYAPLATMVTARGRLPDMGLHTGRITTNALPVATGTTIRDPATGLIAYVTLGALLVPYTESI